MVDKTSAVLVYLSMNGCGHCENFSTNFWDKTVKMVNESFPNIKIININISKDLSQYPSNINFKTAGVPGFILIQSNIWEESINSKINPKPEIKDGLHSMNTIFNANGNAVFVQQYNAINGTDLKFYDRNNLDSFKLWISDTIALMNPIKIKKKIDIVNNNVKIDIPKPQQVCTVKIISRRK